MTQQPLQLYAVFHLNLAYSSIDEDQRALVIQKCYWPLVRLAKALQLPLGIEATGYTLEVAAGIDPRWVDELRELVTDGPCEFVGSGYAQLIGPLVPAMVNVMNLRLGHQVYEQLLGVRPVIGFVNEQAYSSGLVPHYLDAQYDGIIMEWENAAHGHPEWDPAWQYAPQVACGPSEEEILVVWNRTLAFQKFQRYVHGEMTRDDFVDYLDQHRSTMPRIFPLYGNDAEIFGFRPGRYPTEAPLHPDGEWTRIQQLFEILKSDERWRLIQPSDALTFNNIPVAGNRLHLESAISPIPVKKQAKYNVLRWGVTGRNDAHINAACWRIHEALFHSSSTRNEDWRELCYLWSSDFRTH
ncbi:MAG: glycoside hydrolase family 57, partial [Nitrospirota bacterium]|nr:glycoside hydrolase family 57 [Nitrospirota bacterium]